MLGKLVKYEFKASGRLIPIAYLIVGMLSITGILLSLTRLYMFSVFSFLLLMLAGGGALIMTYVIIFIRFYRGMFGSEGYLAMTLPVTPTQLYLSKSIVSTVWLFLSYIMYVVAAISAVFSVVLIFARESGAGWGDIREEIMWGFNNMTPDEIDILRRIFNPGMIAVGIIIMVVGFLAVTAQIHFCVTLSSVKPFQNLGIGAIILAVLAMVIVNGVLNYTLTLLVPLSLVFDPATGWSLSTQSMYSTMGYYSSNMAIGIGGYFLQFVYAFALPFLTIHLIRTKVSLK